MPCLENISILPYEKSNMRGVHEAGTRLCRNMSPFLFFLERKDLLTTGIWHLKLDFKIGQFCTSVTISLNVSGTTQITRRYRIVLISFTLEHSILGKKIVYKNTIIILLRRQLLKADPGPAHRLIEFIGGGGGG